ncbi:hypothetical protein QYS49_31790 [Marivirga salinae]|uniref:Uncharacterized protein n=1 Tax=Marivirga salinarum TaxID=3059078 RepID=A0AA51NB11_9BACT|nr:hypothetical protein [Marivirga sp. BDSF4-3]WMN11922.1 hypothetical protein QYS49_31790 [Marivirga sp. BDSF4-3]
MNKFYQILILIVAFISGIIVNEIFVNWSFITFNPELSISNLLSVGTTLIIAIFLTNYFDRSKFHSRKKVDLIINRLGEINNVLNDISNDLEDGKISYQKAASRLKKIYGIYLSISKEAENLKNINISKLGNNQFEDKFKHLKDLLTNTPKIDKTKISNSEIPLEVKDGIIFYHQNRLTEINYLFEILNNTIFGLQLNVEGK